MAINAPALQAPASPVVELGGAEIAGLLQADIDGLGRMMKADELGATEQQQDALILNAVSQLSKRRLDSEGRASSAISVIEIAPHPDSSRKQG